MGEINSYIDSAVYKRVNELIIISVELTINLSCLSEVTRKSVFKRDGQSGG